MSRRVENNVNLIAAVCEIITSINPDEKTASAEDCYDGDDVSTSRSKQSFYELLESC